MNRHHFRRAYDTAFAEHLEAPGEATLHAAYELGRRAVGDGLSILELSAVHHEALAQVLRRAAHEDGAGIVAGAGAFLSESLSAYEMVRRGFVETRQAAALERRQAQTIRRLSTFLGDASLASDATGSLAEVLQLVAEEARELVDAMGCVVAVRAGTGTVWTSAASPPQLTELLDEDRELHFLATTATLQAHGRPLVLRTAAELRRHSHVVALPGGEGIRGWLGVPLAALDGRLLGWIEVFEWERDGPTELDEALVVHLAQMTAAALERTRLYAE